MDTLLADGDNELSLQLSKPLVKRSWLGTITYGNPWPTWVFPSFVTFMRAVRAWLSKPSLPKQEVIDRSLPVESPDTTQLHEPPSDPGIQITWLGHASCLIQLDGVNILTDPITSDRCSFSSWIGPKRYTRAPCHVQDLPAIHAVVISHSHYDHLDLATVKQLHQRFGSRLHWFVPMGLKSWFSAMDVPNVTELMWWQSCQIEDKPVTFVSVPAQHWSNRFLHDRFRTLWCGWAILGTKCRFYFAGDTGYCPAFKEIGKKYGPFTCAAIPIGAYCPRVMMVGQHIDPEEAVKVHQDVKSQKSIGIHWGTFDLSAEGYLEPKEKLEECVRNAGLNPAEFITVQHGKVNFIPGDSNAYGDHSAQ